MDYLNPVLYSLEGRYMVLRMIATISAVPIYAWAGGPFQTIEAALTFAALVAEKEV